jgi:hypothetical protein
MSCAYLLALLRDDRIVGYGILDEMATVEVPS